MKCCKTYILCALVSLLAVAQASAQSIVGAWSIDDTPGGAWPVRAGTRASHSERHSTLAPLTRPWSFPSSQLPMFRGKSRPVIHAAIAFAVSSSNPAKEWAPFWQLSPFSLTFPPETRMTSTLCEERS